MMDAETVRWILTVLLGVLAWFGKRTVDAQERKIDTLKLEVENIKQNYLHKGDFKEFKDELKEMFQEIKQDIRELKHVN